jgi:hypothetical protein
MLTRDEQLIFDYLQPLGRQFTSAKEICRRAGGKQKYTKDAYWAKPLLKRMEKKGLLEMDAQGYWRIKPPDKEQDDKHQIPLDPRIAQILSSSGKDFTGSHVLEDDTVYTTKPPKSADKSKGKRKKG